MPDPAWWPTEALLAAKVGGAAYLVQLLDKDGDGIADSALVAECLAVARAAVRGAVEKRHAPEVLDALAGDTTAFLRRLAVILAAEVAWSDGTGAIAMPETFLREIERARADLDDIANGRRFLGRAAGASGGALNHPVGVVDHDPYGTRVSIAGFSRRGGFR